MPNRVRLLPCLAALSVAAASAATVDALDADGPRDVEQLHAPSAAKALTATSIAWFEWSPGVMRYDRPTNQPMVLRASISGGATSAVLTVSNGGGTITLLDNGVAPDSVAGDGIFSANVPVQVFIDRNTADRVARPYLGQVVAMVNGVADGGAYNLFGFVMPAEAAAIPVTTLSATARRTPWLINVRDDAYATDNGRERVTQSAYAFLPDNFHFVHIINGPQQYIANRFHGVIRNNVQGIGLGAIDVGASFGSSARLIGFTVFPNWTFYDLQARGFIHETGHQWADKFAGVLGDPRNAGHWPIGSMASDVMGISLVGGAGGSLSCVLTSNGSSITTQAATQGAIYNGYELYVMGLAASVPNGFVVTDQTAAQTLSTGLNWCNGSTYNLATTPITQSLVTSTYGARVPSSATAPRYFHAMTVVASGGRLLDDNELRYLSWITQRAQTPGFKAMSEGFGTGAGPTFYDATGERAFLDVNLDSLFLNGFEGQP